MTAALKMPEWRSHDMPFVVDWWIPPRPKLRLVNTEHGAFLADARDIDDEDDDYDYAPQLALVPG